MASGSGSALRVERRPACRRVGLLASRPVVRMGPLPLFQALDLLTYESLPTGALLLGGSVPGPLRSASASQGLASRGSLSG